MERSLGASYEQMHMRMFYGLTGRKNDCALCLRAPAIVWGIFRNRNLRRHCVGHSAFELTKSEDHLVQFRIGRGSVGRNN